MAHAGFISGSDGLAVCYGYLACIYRKELIQA